MRCVNVEAKHNSTVVHDWKKKSKDSMHANEQRAVRERIEETGAFTINLIFN